MTSLCFLSVSLIISIVASELAVGRRVGFSSLPENQLYKSVADIAASDIVVFVGLDGAGVGAATVELELGVPEGDGLEKVDAELVTVAAWVELLEVAEPIDVEAELELGFALEGVAESDTERPLSDCGAVGRGTFKTTS